MPPKLYIFKGLLILTLSISTLSLVYRKEILLDLDLWLIRRNWSLFFMMDKYSKFFSLTVIFISSLIFLYSIGYIHGENEKDGFFIILFIFVVSILVLIYSFNLSSLLIGWDGLGITSFLLIIFYHNNKSLCGSLITLTINRMGDCFILISLPLFIIEGSWRVNTFNTTPFLSYPLILTAALTKRAQFPFSSWLPIAIAAPTPVSSLVHSSTLVTAGAYVIFRFYDQVKLFNTQLIVVSLITRLVGGVIACKSWDLKEIVAHSTLRQIGFIMLLLAMGFKKIAFFHLLVHAYFKSTLFIGSGIIIHKFLTQDIRKINLFKINEMVKTRFIICLLSIMGEFFLAGFYSKDMIMEGVINSCYFLTPLIIARLFIVTSMYSIRLIDILSLNNYQPLFLHRIERSVIDNVVYTEAILSIISGGIFLWSVYPCGIEFRLRGLKAILFSCVIVGILINVFINLRKENIFLSIWEGVRFTIRKRVYFHIIYLIVEKFFFPLFPHKILKISNKIHAFLGLVNMKSWMLITFLIPPLILLN